MTSLAIVSLVTAVIIAIAGAGIAVYTTTPQLAQPATVTPVASDHAIALAPAQQLTTPTPQETPPSQPSVVPSRRSLVQGTTTQLPSPTITKPSSPTPTKKPTPTPTPVVTNSDLAIAFVDTPSSVKAGQSFEVKWQVTGPAGTTGHDTQLKLSYETHKSSGGSTADSKVNNSSSFGSFTVPKVFSSRFSFGSEPGELHLTATASVGDKTLTTTKVIELQ